MRIPEPGITGLWAGAETMTANQFTWTVFFIFFEHGSSNFLQRHHPFLPDDNSSMFVEESQAGKWTLIYSGK
nr:hypothetical protein Itr_chr07CG05430 [Ipomoea trifida]